MYGKAKMYVLLKISLNKFVIVPNFKIINGINKTIYFFNFAIL